MSEESHDFQKSVRRVSRDKKRDTGECQEKMIGELYLSIRGSQSVRRVSYDSISVWRNLRKCQRKFK